MAALQELALVTAVIGRSDVGESLPCTLKCLDM